MSNALKHDRFFEFWTGRAGSGKTHNCVDQIARALRESPRGTPLWMIVPEQASLQTERRLLDCLGSIGGGYTRARVLSFRLLARESLNQNGGWPTLPLADSGRIMILHRVLQQLKSELQTLGSTPVTPKMASTVSSLLSEFQDNGWKMPRLESLVSTLPDNAGTDSKVDTHELRGKLNDLLLVWKNYEGLLEKADCSDPYQVTQAAIDSMGQWKSIHGARVWIDGFASFTSQEWEMIEALMQHASWMAMTLCMDPGRLVFPPGKPPCLSDIEPTGPEKLFGNIECTLKDCIKKVNELNWSIRIRRFHAPYTRHTRFDSSPPLKFMEHRVLGRMQPEILNEDNELLTREPERSPQLPPPMEFLEAEDHAAEIEAIARRIVDICRHPKPIPQADDNTRPPMTWRDIAVITRDIELYADTIRTIFHRFNIPFFLDSPRQMQGHPLTRLLLSALNVIRSDWSGDSVVQHLRCGISCIGELNMIDRIENLILTTDPESRAWTDEIKKHDDLFEAWQKTSIFIRELEKCLHEKSPMARTLWSFIENVRAADQMDQWIETCRSGGDQESVLLHEQAWEQTIHWLEQLDMVELILAGSDPGEPPPFKSRINEIMDLIDTGLGTIQARLIPPTLNQVTVGSVERSRTPEVGVAFVIGMNEGDFPRLVTPGAFLNDDERNMIHTGLGQEIRSRYLHEYFLAYVALTRASFTLVVSRPLVDSQERTVNPSPFFSTLARCFPRVPCRAVGRSGLGDDEHLPLRVEEWNMRLAQAVDAACDPTGLAKLLGIMRQGDPLHQDALPPRASDALFHARKRHAPTNRTVLPPGLMKQYWKSRPHLAVTSLERYSQCPFRFFLNDMLEVHPRAEGVMNEMDIGNIRHGILDSLFRNLSKDSQLDWGRTDPAQALEIIDREILNYRENYYSNALKYSPYLKLHLDRIRDELRIFVQGIILVASRSETLQIRSEHPICYPIQLSNNAPIDKLVLNGKIDRIDVFASSPEHFILYDYKTGNRDIRLGLIVGGVDIQLATYCIGLSETGEMSAQPFKTGGFFYWPMTTPLKKGPGGIQPGSTLYDTQWFEKRRPEGVFTDTATRYLDAQVAAKESSLAFNFRRKTDGSLSGQTQSHLPEDVMKLLLGKTGAMIARNVENIAKGMIPLEPYMINHNKTACEFCDYAETCRIGEVEHDVYRQIPPLTRMDLIDECRKPDGD